jgi:hypothetical protein
MTETHPVEQPPSVQHLTLPGPSEQQWFAPPTLQLVDDQPEQSDAHFL